MKKIYLILILLLSLNLQAQQVKVYNVIRVSSNDIYCGTSTTPLKEGSKINDNSIIQWKNYHQWFEAQDSYGKTRYFSKESMESRHKRTVSEYLKDLLNRCVNTTSGKGVEQLLAGKNKDMYSEKRLALVIGNANYNNIVSLRNPLNDASLISGDLRDLGFDVMCLYDGTTREIQDVLEAFRQKVVNEHYDLVLFYYSGHGLKSDYKNWIVPINAKLESQTGSRYECIDGHYLLEIIKESGCSNSIVIMDACRTEVNWSKAFMQGGAISMEPEQNMLLAFSTRDYEEAKDIVPNVKGYGPYAAALSKALRTEGLTLDEIFNSVKEQVYKSTNETQSPIHINDIRNQIVINNNREGEIKTCDSSPDFTTHDNTQNDAINPDNMIASRKDNNIAEKDNNIEKLLQNGNMYREQNNYKQAYYCYQRAAKMGSVEAEELLGEINEDDFHNIQEAVKFYLKAANKGNSQAQFRLGRYYELVQMDYYAAFQWYQLSAHQGNIDGQNALGHCYFFGFGVSPNIEESTKWYTLSANQGNKAAMHNVNFMKKALNGDPESQYMIGNDYYYGYRINEWTFNGKNYVEACKWLTKAAEKGNSRAQYLLGEIYKYGGYGITANKKLSNYWHAKSKRSAP